MTEVKTLTDASPIFRVFTACQGDPKTLLLDLRPQKQFQKLHIALSYSIRLSANGRALLDYSKNSYDLAWSNDCWWGKPVIVYGEVGLRKDHPVVKFLAAEGKCKSLSVYRAGFERLEQQFPYLCTTSTKANCARRYPSEIVPQVLYLGEWSQAEAVERLTEINVRRVITIHNSPENLKLPTQFRHLRFQLADVDTQNVAPYFNASYNFIEEARAAGQATLVHCGAGVSRSAALVIAYLMRKNTWNAARARAHCVERRSIVQPNDGFWRSLCAFETQLGIGERSDVNAGTTGWHGTDATAGAATAEDAAGAKVEVAFVSAKALAAQQASSAERPKKDRADAREPGRDRANGAAERRSEDRRRSRSRSRSPGAARRRRDQDSGGHDRDRDRDRRRDDDRGIRHGRDDRDGRHRRDGSRDRRDGSRDRRRSPVRDRQPKDPGGSPEKDQQAPAAAHKREAVFEVSKDGKVLGQLRLGLAAANQRAVIGRVPSSDVHLEHLSISRHHAALTTDPSGHLFLTDLGAAHGTNVDGVWMRPNVGRQLQRGNVVRFGASTREYKVITLPSDEQPPPTN